MHSWKSIVAICSSRLCIIVNGVSDRNQMVIVLKLSKFAESVYRIMLFLLLNGIRKVLCCNIDVLFVWQAISVEGLKRTLQTDYILKVILF
jgi:hypothetical protein